MLTTKFLFAIFVINCFSSESSAPSVDSPYQQWFDTSLRITVYSFMHTIIWHVLFRVGNVRRVSGFCCMISKIKRLKWVPSKITDNTLSWGGGGGVPYLKRKRIKRIELHSANWCCINHISCTKFEVISAIIIFQFICDFLQLKIIMGVDEKMNTATETNDSGESQSKKAAKKQAKEAAKAAKVITILIR